MGVGTRGGVGGPGGGVDRSYGISWVFVFCDGVGLVVVYDGYVWVLLRNVRCDWGGVGVVLVLLMVLV